SGASSMTPEFVLGHFPQRPRNASAHARICSKVSGRSAFVFRTPRRLASSFANEDPPGRPRFPTERAAFTPDHVSPDASAIKPELHLGHWPLRLKCESAHANTLSSVSLGRANRFSTPR